jgi:hypothetical protein
MVLVATQRWVGDTVQAVGEPVRKVAFAVRRDAFEFRQAMLRVVTRSRGFGSGSWRRCSGGARVLSTGDTADQFPSADPLFATWIRPDIGPTRRMR